MLTYGQSVRAAIERRGMTIKQVCRAAGLAEMTIYALIWDKGLPNLSTLLKIMDALEMDSLDELLGLRQ